ncbi:hypothetical protein R6Q57_008596 [Mikania cordata]
MSITNFGPLKIPLEDVLTATNNFAKANIIGHGGFGPAYKGRLLRSGDVLKIAALRLDRRYGLGDVEFLTEISMLSDLSHPNLVSFVGFCDDKHEKIILIKHVANGSLIEHLNNPNLTLIQRMRIILGVARVLAYLHHDEGQGRDYAVIHRNVNSSTILLDENWEPKLSGFIISVKQSFNRMEHVVLCEPVGTFGYMDPAIENRKGVNYKSDIYSLGVVLLEILSGKTAFDGNSLTLVPWAKHHLENGNMTDIIHPHLLKNDQTSLRNYLLLAFGCISEDQSHRLDATQIVSRLEEFMELQQELEKFVRPRFLYYLLFSRRYISLVCAETLFSPCHIFNFQGNMKIRLADIKLATGNFLQMYKIQSHEDYLYRGALYPFNEQGERHINVVIKRYPSGHVAYRKKEFLNEIEMLTSVKHRNIVTLLGFCVEESEMILVIEKLSNHHLGYHLGDAYYPRRRDLTWEKRLKICIDVAHALNYLHSEMEDKRIIINGDICCYNIGLDENWGAKIIDFWWSLFLPSNQEDQPNRLIGRPHYQDPDYLKTGKLKTESDVYGFGVVLFEILCGRYANDPIYTRGSDKGLATVARRSFLMGTVDEMIDPIIKEEASESIFILNRGPNKDSLKTFIEIANQCVAETQDQRPTMKVVVKELEKALFFQKNKDNPRISLDDIKVATQNFHNDNYVGGGGFGKVFKGNLQDGKTIVAKRLITKLGQGEQQFLTELEILLEYKNENVIGLVGYCDEEDEKIIIYEYASRGSLDRHLNNASLTWVKRLNICIDVASALHFLHEGVGKQAKVIHRDIKTSNILLNHDWKAKLADFGLSLISPITLETDYVIDYACGTPGYLDPLYEKNRFLTMESDIYSFGVVLFELLCGRSTFSIYKKEGHHLPDIVKNKFKEGKLDEVVFEQIKEPIKPKSLATFQNIAYQCLHREREKRPTMKTILTELKKAMEFQI